MWGEYKKVCVSVSVCIKWILNTHWIQMLQGMDEERKDIDYCFNPKSEELSWKSEIPKSENYKWIIQVGKYNANSMMSWC